MLWTPCTNSNVNNNNGTNNASGTGVIRDTRVISNANHPRYRLPRWWTFNHMSLHQWTNPWTMMVSLNQS